MKQLKPGVVCFPSLNKKVSFTKAFMLAAGALGFQFLIAQNAMPLTDLSSFQSPGATWKLAGDVHADFTKKAVLNTTPGTGVLVNLTDFNNPGLDLLTNMQHGDMDLELDYMMALGSNSGIYMQGRYEIQLLDSWGTVNPTSGDNGGIYERWNEGKPEGQKGYEGHAPRQNASRAPGLWQHLKISFQAPRFNLTGTKLENAKILRVELNGVSIQENVELSGQTRGSLGDEVAKGPLRLQGDHGPVAFRNIKIMTYDKPRPEIVNIKYAVYKGKYEPDQDYKKLPPEAEGSSVILSSNVSNIANEFLIYYTGTIKIKEAGEYSFNLNTAGGRGTMKIKDLAVIPAGTGRGRGRGRVTLAPGDYPIEITYSKYLDYAKPSLGLAVSGPGIREFVLSDVNVDSGDPVDPILINAFANTTLRSFVDIDTFRVTHAVNVGSIQQVHYTYDMDKGMIVQLWRGGFLDATPMWHSRGDGSSKAVGMVQKFGRPMPAIEMLSSADAAWSADTTGSGYRPKGYALDDSDRPTFRYIIYNEMVNDQTRVLPNGQGIQREISVQNPASNVYVRLAEADNIETISDNLYLLGDKKYYLRIDDAAAAKPIIRNSGGGKELIIPIQTKISYSILF